MNTQTSDTAISEKPSRWRKLQSILTAFEQATAYDPQLEAAATIRHLRGTVIQLEARVDALEDRRQNGIDNRA